MRLLIIWLGLAIGGSFFSLRAQDVYPCTLTFGGAFDQWWGNRYNGYGGGDYDFGQIVQATVHNNGTVPMNGGTVRLSAITDGPPNQHYAPTSGSAGFSQMIPPGGSYTFWVPINVWFRSSSWSAPLVIAPSSQIVKASLDGSADFVHIQFTCSGGVTQTSGNSSGVSAWLGTQSGSVSIHLYSDPSKMPLEGRPGIPDRLTVNFTVVDRSEGPGSMVKLRISGSELFSRSSKPSGKDGRFFTRTLVEDTDRPSLENVLVEVLVGERVERSERVPAMFLNRHYVADLGTIHIGNCKGCSTCMSGNVTANLAP